MDIICLMKGRYLGLSGRRNLLVRFLAFFLPWNLGDFFFDLNCA
jgi:hypothetical protein